MKRTFIGIRIPLAQEYETLRNELQRYTPYDQIVWVAPKLNHLTLRFIGQTPEDKIVPIRELLANIAAQMPTFNLTINKLGLFGSHYCPRVIWLGIEKTPPLLQLVSQINEGLTELGFEAAEGNFVPHITLGRIHQIDNKKKFSQLIEELQPTFHQTIPVEKVIFFRSRLEKTGPVYSELSHVSLQKQL